MKLRKIGLFTLMASTSLLTLTACGDIEDIEITFDSFNNKISMDEHSEKLNSLLTEIQNIESFTYTCKQSQSSKNKSIGEMNIFGVQEFVYKYNKNSDIFYEEMTSDLTTKSEYKNYVSHEFRKEQTEKVGDLYYNYDLITNSYKEKETFDVISIDKDVASLEWKMYQNGFEYYNDNNILTAQLIKEKSNDNYESKEEITIQIKKEENKYIVKEKNYNYYKKDYENYSEIVEEVFKNEIIIIAEEPEIKSVDQSKFYKATTID